MRLSIGLALGLMCPFVFAAQNAPRTLTFEDRVNAQAAIARVYYFHQDGATRPFEAAVPRSVHENRVRTYLEQSAALSVYWKTAVTDEALGRELERMAKTSRMPERLSELFAALGNDPFLIKECLARPILVDRLARNFQAMDPAMHVTEKTRAERLRDQIVTGALDPSVDHPSRTVSEIGTGDAEAGDPSNQIRSREALSRDQFLVRRAQLPGKLGEVSAVAETHDDFKFDVILSETADTLRVASYSVRKTSWDEWWATLREGFRGATVATVATGHTVSALSRVSRVKALGTGCGEQGWHNGSLDDAPHYGFPDGRWAHTAVWTGSEMLIFGGFPTQFLLADHGKRYDPATDTWTVMSARNAPTARAEHTAVWTGNSMIVWGGSIQGVDGVRQTGGRYDPNTDTWTRVSAGNAPSARAFHSAVWTGTEMVVWGGAGESGVKFNTGGRYNPDTDTWRPTSTSGAPSPRTGHTAVWTGSRMVVWSAGSGGRYDPAADTWLPVSYSPLDTLSGHSAVWTGHFMLIWGGTHTVVEETENGPHFHQVPTDAGARYNPATDRWSPTSSVGAPSPVSEHAAVWTGTEMLIWGGAGSARRYEVTTDTWAPISDAGAVVWGARQTAVWTGQQMIAWGGYRPLGSPSQNYFLATGGRYDPASDTWTPTSLGSGAYGQTTVWTGSEMIAWGGSAAGGHRFDPATDTWSAMTRVDEPVARTGHSAVWAGTSMVVWGGSSGALGDLNSGGRYDPATDSWTPMSTSGAPSARSAHSAAWTGSEMLVWGGADAANLLGTGGKYDPASDHWAATSMVGAPSPRYFHTAVWSGSHLVIWGGRGQVGLLQSGARYNPQTDTWAPTSLSSAPSARADHTAVWVGDRMVVWGGLLSSNAITASGGRYDPANDSWTPTSLAGNPSGHTRHSAVSTGRAMIVWGGVISILPSSPVNTGLLYDPATDHWTKLTKTGEPEIIYSHTAIWTGSVMILWSGSHGGQFVLTAPIDGDCDGDGVSVSGGDCDDADPSTYPSAPPICDGKVNNCSDPYWPDTSWSFSANERDNDEDGFTVCQGDCDDGQSSVYPGAPEVCDGVATDCSSPGWPSIPDEADADHDGVRICQGDCDDTRAAIRPGRLEDCDGLDNDCDGSVDENPSSLCRLGSDEDECHDLTCQGIDGCVLSFPSNPCDDSNPCTTNDTCSKGYCQGTPQAGAACNDDNPCSVNDTCDSVAHCSGTPATGLLCDDHNGCTVNDVCNASSSCSGTVTVGAPCNDGNPCTFGDACSSSSGGSCHGSPAADGAPCDAGNPCTSGDACHFGLCYTGPSRDCDDNDRCTGDEYCDFHTGACESYSVPTCDDHNECTADTCDPLAGCVFSPLDAPCDDGDACTVGDACVNGGCLWGAVDDCDDDNPCTDDSCDLAIGCVHAPNVASCDDGDTCTGLDACQGGACVGSNPVICAAPAPCQAAGVCEPATGLCHFAASPDGTTCDDGDSGTTGDSCQDGVCTGASSCSTQPAPKSEGYFKKLCKGGHGHPHAGDALTDADAVCVGQLTATFAGISTVDDLCAEWDHDTNGSHHDTNGPNGKECEEKAERELMALALNICRDWVCLGLEVDSNRGSDPHDHALTTVQASLDTVDGILSDPARYKAVCKTGKCLAKEINNGKALHHTSLVLSKESGPGNKVRLTWDSPVMEDGSGEASSYTVWRRVLNADAAFVKLAEIPNLTYVDATAGTGAYEYEVTFTIEP